MQVYLKAGGLMRSVWAEVNLDNLKGNLLQIRQMVGATRKIIAVVKANAYGHGAVRIARAALEAKADMLAVAIAEEGIQLRLAGLECPIVILGPSNQFQLQQALAYDLIPGICSSAEAGLLSEIALKNDMEATVHIKVDSGMGRIGFAANDEGVADVCRVDCLPAIRIAGTYSHLATADDDSVFMEQQLARFEWFCGMLQKSGVDPGIRHIANSAAIMLHPQTYLDAVRPGIIMYGYDPRGDRDLPQGFAPVLALKAMLTHVKHVPAEMTISYGRTFTADKDMVIATLPVGYADGYSRLFSNKGPVLIGGTRHIIAGRVCMDQFMVAIENGVMVQPGDEAVLLGSQGSERISADELASLIGTISYEFLAALSGRIPRLYMENGREIACEYLEYGTGG